MINSKVIFSYSELKLKSTSFFILLSCFSFTLTAQSVKSQSLCEGEDFFLRASTLTVFNADTSFVQWIGPDSTIYDNPLDTLLELTNLKIGNSGQYELFVAINNVVGGRDTVSKGSIELEINQVGIPNGGANVYICEAGTLSISALGGESYRWTGPNGFVDSINSTIMIDSFSLQDTGWYKVELTNSICTSVVLDSVNARIGYIASASSSLDEGDQLCYADTLKLFSSGGGTYDWSGPDGFSSAEQNPVINAALTGGEYQVIVSSEDLCIYDEIDSTGQRHDTIILDIDIKEKEYEFIYVDSFFVCPSYESARAGSVLAWNSSYQYLWTGPDTLEGFHLEFDSISSAQAGTYYLQVTKDDGCVRRDTVELVVRPRPTLSIQTNSPVCEGELLSLAVTIDGKWGEYNGGPFYEVEYSDGSTYSGYGSSVNLIRIPYTWNGARYTFSGRDSLGCFNSIDTIVTVYPLADISKVFIADSTDYSTQICLGDTLFLSASNSGASDFLWTGPNSFEATSADTFIANYNQVMNGRYSIVMTTEYGCTNSVSKNVYNKGSLPTSSISIKGECEGENIQLIQNGGYFDSHSWSGPDGFSSHERSPFIYGATQADEGMYYDTISNSSCDVIDSIYVEITPYLNKIYVDSSATGSQDGSSWADAYTDLQQALDYCCYDTIWVAKGTYIPTKSFKQNYWDRFHFIDSSARDNKFILKNGTKIFGGFAGTETSLSERTKSTILANPTILSGDVDSTASLDSNAYNVLYINGSINSISYSGGDGDTTVLDGFIIEKGNADDTRWRQGSGLYANQALMDIRNCNFRNNSADSEGGAIYCKDTYLNIKACSFENNFALSQGGAIKGGEMLITNSIFYKNSSNSGYAVYNSGDSSRIANSTFVENFTYGNIYGEVISNSGDSLTIRNSIFWNNPLDSFSVDRTGRPLVIDVRNGYQSRTILTNNILQNSALIINPSGPPISWYTNRYGFVGDLSTNFYAEDPLFVNSSNPKGADGLFGTADDGIRVQDCSPAINRGDNSFAFNSYDISGGDRIQNSTVDIGAYESDTVSLFTTHQLVSSAGDATCVGTTVTFTCTADNPGINPVFDFKVNGISVQSGPSNEYMTDSLKHNDKVSVDVTANGCMVSSDTIAMTVHTLFYFSMDISRSFCVGGSLSLSADFYSPYSSSYNWTGPMGFSSNESHAGISNAQMDNSGMYHLTITDYRGCTYSDSTEVGVYVPRNVIYVDKDATGGSNDGSSWQDAFTDLQSALEYSCADSIWVAEGTYLPTKDALRDPNTSDVRNKTFVLSGTTKIFGGFAGTEASFSERTVESIKMHPTILSGDIGILNDSSDNVYHVLLSKDEYGLITLDGLTIRGGNANGRTFYFDRYFSVRNRSGGGLYSSRGSKLQIENCIFEKNQASEGGGAIYISIYYRDPETYTINNCEFIENSATGLGGAIYFISFYNGTLNISNTKFIQNNARSGGAYDARTGYTASVNVDACLFDRNSADYSGGAINHGLYDRRPINYSLVNSLFIDNTAQRGGAFYTNTSQDAKIFNCTFARNEASDDGGAIWKGPNRSLWSQTFMTNNIFYKNKKGESTTANGADLFYDFNNDGTHYRFISYNSFQVDNDSFAYNVINVDPLFIDEFDLDGLDDTFGTSDDGFALSKPSPLINQGVDNSIALVYQNDITGDERVRGGKIDLGAYESGLPSYILGVDIKVLPEGQNCEGSALTIVGVPENPGSSSHYQFELNNASIQSGSDSLYTSSSLADGDWIKVTYTSDTKVAVDSVQISMLAHRSKIFVDSSAVGANDGSSWTDAYNDLQRAIEYNCFDTMWVAAGTYLPTKDPGGSLTPLDPRDKAFLLPFNKVILGGFAGTETSLSQRTRQSVATNPSILSGDIGTPNDVSDNSYHVVLAVFDTLNAVLDGFTITKGNANGSGTYIYKTTYLSRTFGAGMASGQSSTHIENCTFTANIGQVSSGFYTQSSNHTLKNCSFTNNTSDLVAGALLTAYADIAIDSCQFSNNISELGAALCNYFGESIQITNSSFTNNIADSLGGGIFNFTSSPTITDCLFTGNQGVRFGGGGMANYESSPAINSSLFQGNSAKQGGGIGNAFNSNPVIDGCFFIGNSVIYAGGGVGNSFSNPTITNSVFANNVAQGIAFPFGLGGAIANESSSPEISGSTFYNNSAGGGGAIYNLNILAKPIVSNSILWGNIKNIPFFGPSSTASGADIENGSGAGTTVLFSSLQLDSSVYAAASVFDSLGASNFFATDPVFKNIADLDGADNSYGTSDDGLTLNDCILIDKGSNALSNGALDAKGDPRITSLIVDVGAYENLSSNGGITCTAPCLSVITLANMTDNFSNHTETFSAARIGGVIRASNIITGSSQITFEAHTIELNSGFQVDKNAVFNALVGGCDQD